MVNVALSQSSLAVTGDLLGPRLSVIADTQFDASTKITNPLNDLIMKQSMTAQLPDVTSIKSKIYMDRRLAHKEQANAIRTRLSPSLQRAMDLNSETGSPSWLIVLPL